MGIATPPQQRQTSPPSSPPHPADRKIADWIFSHDIPSDVSVVVDGVSYALHKFPLIARSGWMRRIVAEAKDSELSLMNLPEFPGGAETFELVAKFCYGMSESFAIDANNVAALRCAAEYLDMAEVYATGNLLALTEAYLMEEAVKSMRACVVVLQTCEDLLPMAEEIGIVSVCVKAAAAAAAAMASGGADLGGGAAPRVFSRADLGGGGSGHMEFAAAASPKPQNRRPPPPSSALASSPPDASSSSSSSSSSWIDDLSRLRIDFFHRTISSMKSLRASSSSIAAAISHYAQQSLQPLLKNQSSLPKLKLHSPSSKSTAELKYQRVVVEMLVGMMPPERNAFSVSFLLSMLKIATFLDASVSCRVDLEKRIGLQLEQATVDDLLLPSFSYSASDTLFDIDTISRIVVSFLQQDKEDEKQMDYVPASALFDGTDRSSDRSSIPHSRIMKVARLLDSYLAEVAPDANLTVPKFVAFAELMPDYARVVDDGLYRAIDVYIKAHPVLGDLDRRTICSLMNCQKLSQEACRHASQNERLPVQVTVQVLYFEQMRLRNSVVGTGGAAPDSPVAMLPKDRQYMVAMQKENMELKMEVNRLKTRLNATGTPTGGMSERELSPEDEDEDEEEEDEEEEEEAGRGRRRRAMAMARGSTAAAMMMRRKGGNNNNNNNKKTTTAAAVPTPDPSPATAVALDKSAGGGNNSKSRFFQSVSKTLGKLNPFSRNSSTFDNGGGLKSSRPSDVRSSRRPRRHSIS